MSPSNVQVLPGSSVMMLIFLAIRMSQKHELMPSTLKTKQYRKSIVIGSASSWAEFELDWFRVTFDQMKHDNLPEEVFLGIPKTDSESETNINDRSKHFFSADYRIDSVVRSNTSDYSGAYPV